MSYTNYINNKMHHNDKYKIAEGYPCILSNVKKKETLNYETTKTANGITFTDNGDGTVTANGTATDTTGFYCSANTSKCAVNFPAGSSYAMGGCPAGGSSGTYYINFALKNSADSSWTLDTLDIGNGIYPASSLFTNKVVDRCYAWIVIRKGTVCDNLVFKPQIEVYPAGIPTLNILRGNSADSSPKTENGITFTDNRSTTYRVVTIKGTATADAEYNFKDFEVTKKGVYYMHAVNTAATTDTYFLQADFIKDGEIIHTEKSAATGAYVNVINYDCTSVKLKLVVKAGTTVNNVRCNCVFKLIRNDFEPYKLMGEKSNNLLKLPYAMTSSAENGVTWSADADGRVHADGTATGYSHLTIYNSAVPSSSVISYGFYGDSSNLAMELLLYDKDNVVVGKTAASALTPDSKKHLDLSLYPTAIWLQVVVKRHGDTTTGYTDTTYADDYPFVCEGTKIPDEYEPIGKYKLPIGNIGKNLINIDDMINDYLTKNADGTYTITKTDSGRFSKSFVFDNPIPRGTAITISADLVDTNSSYMYPLQIVYAGNAQYLNTTVIYTVNVLQTGATFITNIDVKEMTIYQECSQPVGTYTTFKNFQVEYGKQKTAYEPYRKPYTTNIWLDKQISRQESVSAKADELPQLKLVSGTNVIDSAADIVPSDIKVRYSANR